MRRCRSPRRRIFVGGASCERGDLLVDVELFTKDLTDLTQSAAPVVPRSGRCHARHNGFDLHAELCVPADRRDRLERLCRYVLRPPVAQDRFGLTADGHVRLTLKRPWANGTTHLEFEPLDLLARLAALTPRPRINLVLYHGVLAPRAAWRALVVRFGPAVHPCSGGGRRAVTEMLERFEGSGSGADAGQP